MNSSNSTNFLELFEENLSLFNVHQSIHFINQLKIFYIEFLLKERNDERTNKFFLI